MIHGKKIIFNEEENDLIQKRKNSIIYKSMLKDETKIGFLDSPFKDNINNNDLNNMDDRHEQIKMKNEIDIAPKNCISLNNNNISYKEKINGVISKANGNNLIRNNKIFQGLNNAKNIPCTCSKSHCQKKYCACFSSGNYCQGCDCKGCLNIQKEGVNSILLQNDENMDANILNSNAISVAQVNKYQNRKPLTIECNCTKSKCMKKYCECYKAGAYCGKSCRCFDCQNKKNESEHNSAIINEIQNIDIRKERINELKEECLNYRISSMGIYIYKKKIFIEERVINMNDQKINIITSPKLTRKKRNRFKKENSNLNTYWTTANSSRRIKKDYPNINSHVKCKKLIIN